MISARGGALAGWKADHHHLSLLKDPIETRQPPRHLTAVKEHKIDTMTTNSCGSALPKFDYPSVKPAVTRASRLKALPLSARLVSVAAAAGIGEHSLPHQHPLATRNPLLIQWTSLLRQTLHLPAARAAYYEATCRGSPTPKPRGQRLRSLGLHRPGQDPEQVRQLSC